MTSVMLLTFSPQVFNARTADSRPGPGPLTFTSKFCKPYSSIACLPAFSAATCAAKGVLFLDPLKPDPPAVAHAKALPCLSVMVMMVLLKDACMNAIPSITVLRAFFFVVFGVSTNYPSTLFLVLLPNRFFGPLSGPRVSLRSLASDW